MTVPTPTAKDVARFHGKHRLTAVGCSEWMASRNEDGYGRFRIQGITERAHRVAWVIANGPLPPGAHVLHSCDNPPCVLPAHLFLGDQPTNVADMLAKGRSPVIGTGNPKLSAGDRAEIMRLAWRVPRSELALRFGVSEDRIYRLWREAAPQRPLKASSRSSSPEGP